MLLHIVRLASTVFRLSSGSGEHRILNGLPRTAITVLGLAAWCVLLPLSAARGQDSGIDFTSSRADQSLRSAARVNPSTLAMELSIPLSGYPGRGGVSLPVSINYSSKVWRIDYRESFCINAPRPFVTENEAVYAERSAAGWTSSLGVPRIEYPVDSENQVYDYEGKPTSKEFPAGCDSPSNPAVYYIKRILVHMPDGSSHELRKDDSPYFFDTQLPNPNYDKTGIFYAVDGSHLRFDFDSGTLYLPDGSRYIFPLQPNGELSATQYLDRNGNTLSYNAAARQWTDTLGRVITVPLPINVPHQGPGQTVGDQPYAVTGVGGAPQTYILSWRRLQDVLRIPEPLKYDGAQQCNGQIVSWLIPSLFTTPDSATKRVCDYDLSLFNPIVLAGVGLPNGTSYSFKFNIYGEIEQIDYPTGGYERFSYSDVESLSYTPAPYKQANRGVVSRWVSTGGAGASESQWLYSNAGGSVDITAPDGTRTQRLVHPGNLTTQPLAYGFERVRAGMPYEERVHNAAGVMLRRKLTEWVVSGPIPNGWATAERHPKVVREVGLVLDTGGNA
ncbi:MAG: hypothetical protein M3R15_08555, partial [Acidobacteriota bacterium]|nr:hypothetical protein [Acidobacteriota bacterium]